MIVLFVFLAGAGIDLAWTRYIQSVQDRRRLSAANYSVTIAALSLLGVTTVVRDGWMALPYLLGLWLGTYVAVEGK